MLGPFFRGGHAGGDDGAGRWYQVAAFGLFSHDYTMTAVYDSEPFAAENGDGAAGGFAADAVFLLEGDLGWESLAGFDLPGEDLGAQVGGEFCVEDAAGLR